MSLKILGGEFGGRLLKAPKGNQTRPTTSMIRKAVFDILQPQIEGAIFLDLFSGSGAMGIEALSRGAEQAIFVEAHPQAIRCLKENLSLLKIIERAIVLPQDIFKALSKLQEMKIGCDIIYADPPYDQLRLYTQLLTWIDQSTLLKPHGLLFLESPVPSPLEKSQAALRQLRPLAPRKYGASELYLYVNPGQ